MELEPVEKFEECMRELITKAAKAEDSGDAMRFSQAAVNIANAVATVARTPNNNP
jgi:hypothetical protein